MLRQHQHKFEFLQGLKERYSEVIKNQINETQKYID